MKLKGYKVDLLFILYNIEDKRNYKDKIISKKNQRITKK